MRDQDVLCAAVAGPCAALLLLCLLQLVITLDAFDACVCNNHTMKDKP